LGSKIILRHISQSLFGLFDLIIWRTQPRKRYVELQSCKPGPDLRLDWIGRQRDLAIGRSARLRQDNLECDDIVQREVSDNPPLGIAPYIDKVKYRAIGTFDLFYVGQRSRV
jgi:hypothetical protein